MKCIAGEVAVVRDVEAGEGGARRHLSRTISVTGSTAKDTIVAGRDGGRDYTEINSIPPLPLYALMLADLDTSYKGPEEAVKGTKMADGEGSNQSSEDQYADLFQVGFQTPTTTTFDVSVSSIDVLAFVSRYRQSPPTTLLAWLRTNRRSLESSTSLSMDPPTLDQSTLRF